MKNLPIKCLGVALLLLAFTGCGSGFTGIAAIDAGPLEVGLQVDDVGNVTVTGALVARLRFGLGPIGITVGIQKAVEYTSKKPFQLLILWEDYAGNVIADAYDIGKPFHLTFSRDQWVSDIRGDKQGWVIVVERILPVEYQSPYDNSMSPNDTPLQAPTSAIEFPTQLPYQEILDPTPEPDVQQITCSLKRQGESENSQCEPQPYDGACNLAAEESGLLVENWYDLTMRFTIGGGGWGTHDFDLAGNGANQLIHMPPDRYTYTAAIATKGTAHGQRKEYEKNQCYVLRFVP